MQKKILIVEDEQYQLNVLYKSLSNYGYKVFACSDGIECLSKAFEIKPDIIIMDCVMPKQDGISTLYQLQQDVRTMNIPVILVSANSQVFPKCEFLKKPLKIDELLKVIQNLIKDNN